MARRDVLPTTPAPTSAFSYELIADMAAELTAKTIHRPDVLIVAGSGLQSLANRLENVQNVDFSDIAGFPKPTVAGHYGRFSFGLLGGKEVAVMQGRLHSYEGYSTLQTTLHIRMFRLMGVTKVLLTNAAGGLNPSFKAGDIMVLNDHINLPGMAGLHPLVGPNDERFGPRFPAMANAYGRADWTLGIAKELGMGSYVHQGTYVYLSGPTYETMAEAKMLLAWGADAVGMSTVPEVVVARHCAMDVVGISLVTNMVKTEPSDAEATHEEVLQMAGQRALDMQKLVTAIVEIWE